MSIKRANSPFFTKVDRLRDNHRGYFLVGEDHVFHVMRCAAQYCVDHGLDPDKEIKTKDPEVFNTCRQIARQRLELLDGVREALIKRWNEERDEISKRAERREDYLEEIQRTNKRDWDSARLSEELEKSIWTHHGIYEAIKVVDAMREPYFFILWHITTWS